MPEASRISPSPAVGTSAIEVTTRCRICGDTDFAPVFDLGRQCVANAFHDGREPVLEAPLELIRCRTCSLVQLRHTVDPAALCDWQRSGINHSMREHLRKLVRRIARVADVRTGDTVLDIGCNDGTALDWYPNGVRTIGVDPADMRPTNCSVFVHDYFSAGAVRGALSAEGAKVITSIAMLHAVNSPRRFVDDLATCLADDGIWVAEMSYLPSILEACSFDTIRHEHLACYRLATFEQLLVGTGLRVFDVEFNGCNGGSFRLFIGHEGRRKTSERVDQVRHLEQYGGFDTCGPYARFRTQVAAARETLLDFLREARERGFQVWGYGASTKGQVALQHCGIGSDMLVAIADRNPEKVGRFTPGTDIRICGEAEMRAAAPDYLLVLPWHFLAEFLTRERDLLENGTRFVVPLPELRVLGPAGRSRDLPW